MNELRSIYFKEWIYRKTDDKGNLIPGTQCYEEEYTGSGFFHQWIVLENYLQAIIELIDGTIILQPFNTVKFRKDLLKRFQIDALDNKNLLVGFICKGLTECEVRNNFAENHPLLKITNIKELPL